MPAVLGMTMKNLINVIQKLTKASRPRKTLDSQQLAPLAFIDESRI
jgi:hypothetical protein